MKKEIWFVEIVHHGNGRVEKRLGPIATEREADKIESGANINLNHDDYSTRIVKERTP